MIRFALALAALASPAASATVAPACFWPDVDPRPTIVKADPISGADCIFRLGDDMPTGKGGKVLPMCVDAVNGEAFVDTCAARALDYVAGRFTGLSPTLPRPHGFAPPAPSITAPPPVATFTPPPPAKWSPPRRWPPFWHWPPRGTPWPDLPVEVAPVPLPAPALLLLGALACLYRRSKS